MAKILIVDDSSLSRRMLRAILQSDGHEVIEATDGISAIERYFLEKPDLVLLDLVMTGMTGEEVLEQLRQMDREAQVIVATADLQALTRQRVEEAGAVGFVNKPFMASNVLNAVNAVLQGAV
ncbi:MAG TPA: response regulator [Cyanobacteria bacterium UBA8803]|nr:response regulator [Cyanobacteria bacterium UBA9273]HBL62259.1 response regulator [Cyanobacteria bacterium UBA8803]